MKSKNHASRIGLLYILDLEVFHGFACMRCRSSTDEPAAANEAEAWDWGFVAWDSLTLINVDPLSSIAFSELCFLKRPNQTRGSYEIIY